LRRLVSHWEWLPDRAKPLESGRISITEGLEIRLALDSALFFRSKNRFQATISPNWETAQFSGHGLEIGEIIVTSIPFPFSKGGSGLDNLLVAWMRRDKDKRIRK
jgi:hypothetical protein